MISKLTRHSLDIALAKLEHARHLTETLCSAIRTFVASEPYHLVSRVNQLHTEEVWSIALDPVPHEIECIAADAVHNIRTPLDKMLAAGFPNDSVHVVGANIRKLFFPFGDDRKSFESRLAKLKGQITTPVIEFLRSVEPHKSGIGKILWSINTLDNQDKHHALLESVKFGFFSTNLGEMIATKGFLLRMGSSRGKNMIPVPDARPGAWHMYQPVDDLRPTTKVHPRMPNKICLEFTSPYNDMEVFTTTPGTQLHVELIPSLDLAFSNLPGFEGTPVVKVLESMRSAASSLLKDYRRTFL